MNKLKISLFVPVILLYALCGYSTTYKRVPAVMSVMRVGTSPTPAASVAFTVRFDEIVTNVTAGAFSLTTTGLTGAGIASITGSGDTYTVTVNTGTGNTGTVRLNVTGTGISPAMSGPVFIGGEVYAIDRTAPTGTLVIQGGALYTNNPAVPLQITASDDNDIFFEMRFSNNNVTWSAWEPFSATKNHTLTPGEGVKNVYMELRDRAGNVSPGINDQIILDQTPPNTTITVNPPSVSGSPAATFVFTSTETGSTFEGSLDGTGFTPVTTPLSFTGLAEGNHTFEVRATDRAGNVDLTAAPYSWEVDLTPPAINAITFPANGYYKEGNDIAFFVSYDEDVNVITTGGVPYIEMNIGGATRRASFVSLAGSNTLIFRYTVVAGDMDLDGVGMSNAIVLNGGVITDGVNNNAGLVLNTTSLPGVFVNTRLVSVVLSTTAPSLLNAPFTVTAIFSEAVTNLTIADFAVSNATRGNLQTSDNITYTLLVAPTVEGPASVQLPAGAVAGLGGVNSNTASNTISVQYDVTAPAVNSVSMSPGSGYNIGDVFYFMVHYSENVIVNTTGGTPYLNVIIGGVTYRAPYLSGSGSSSLTFTYTVIGGELETTRVGLGISIILNGGTIRDEAGNNSNPVLQNITWENIKVFGIRPSVTLSTTAANPVNAPYTLTVTFSEAVTGFVLADLAVTNANLSNLQTTDNITYTVMVSPVADGPVTVQLLADKAINVYTNGNAVSNLHTINYNGLPAITAVDVPANGYYNTGQELKFLVHFSENVTVNGAPYIDLQIGASSVRAGYISGSGTNALTFSYTVVNGDIDEDGVVLGTAIVFNGGTIKDADDNNVTATLNNAGSTAGVYVYTAIPSVTLTTTAGALVNAPFSLQVLFSEAVTGLTINDFAVSNATLTLLQTTDNTLYTVQVTPVADGVVTVSLPANAVVNKGGTGNTVSNILNLTYDGTAPVITSVGVPANGYYKENGVLTFTVHTSEVIQGSGAPYLEVIIGLTIRQATYVSGLGTNALTFSYVVQDGDMDMGGIALGINLIGNNAVLKDAAGNDLKLVLQNIGNTFSVRVNTSRPSATISTAAAARVNAAYIITITFSEAVTGFASTDLTVTNATAGSLQTTDNITYTALITPAADGAVTITLPADQAVNIGANGNRVSNTLSNNYDRTAPVINAGQTFNVIEGDAVGTVAGTVAATEAAGTLQNWTIANDPTGGAFAISANGIITVKDVPLLNSKAGTTVTLNITVSDGLNTSAPTSVGIVVRAINKAPAFDVVADREICITTATQIFAVSGATATEAGQTFDFTISADQPIFDALTIDAAGVISYKLKASASGKANITIIIKDNGGIVNGGVDVFQRTFAINANSQPVVNISSNKGTTVSKGTEVQLTASGAATYNWGSATGAVFTVRPQANTTYNVTGTNAAGCPGTAQITINITADYKVDATNILTPNGDGINDRWVIRNIDSYPDNELKIFDRTGRMVYQRRNYSNDWDGTMNGRRLTEGTYYYILTIDGSGKTIKGYVTIILDQK